MAIERRSGISVPDIDVPLQAPVRRLSVHDILHLTCNGRCATATSSNPWCRAIQVAVQLRGWLLCELIELFLLVVAQNFREFVYRSSCATALPYRGDLRAIQGFILRDF